MKEFSLKQQQDRILQQEQQREALPLNDDRLSVMRSEPESSEPPNEVAGMGFRSFGAQTNMRKHRPSEGSTLQPRSWLWGICGSDPCQQTSKTTTTIVQTTRQGGGSSREIKKW